MSPTPLRIWSLWSCFCVFCCKSLPQSISISEWWLVSRSLGLFLWVLCRSWSDLGTTTFGPLVHQGSILNLQRWERSALFDRECWVNREWWHRFCSRHIDRGCIFCCLRWHRWYRLRWHRTWWVHLRYLFYILWGWLWWSNRWLCQYRSFLRWWFLLYLSFWNLFEEVVCWVWFRILRVRVQWFFCVAWVEWHRGRWWWGCRFWPRRWPVFLFLFRLWLLRWFPADPEVVF